MRFLKEHLQRIFTSIVLALVILGQAGLYDLARAASCDTDNYEGYFIGPDNKTTYAVTKTPLSWQDAQSLAQSSSGRLVVVTSLQQNDAIAANLGSYFTAAPSPSAGNKAWIGLSDPLNTALWCMEGQTCNPWPQRFTWANGFSAFSNYSSRQPDGYCTNAERTVNPDGNCYGEPWVAMSSIGKWSDEGDHGTTPITLKGIVEWPNQTLDCAKTVTPAMDPPVVDLPDSNTALWCTNSTRSNMVQCLPTTDGSQICPLEQVACQDNCPTAYAWNAQTSRCEAPSQTTTGYAQATQGVTEIVKYEPRGHTATSISDYKSSSSGILDVVRFRFGMQSGQVVLLDECAWGGSGNCGNCATPHWNGWCRGGTDLPETRNGDTLTVTANVYDYTYDPNSAYCDRGFVKFYDGESGAPYCMGCPTEGYDPESGNTYTYYSCTGELRYGKSYTFGATAMADVSEFLSCPSGYQPSTPLNQQQCQQVLTVWGNQTGVTDCSQPELYSCTAPVQACPNGGILDSATGVCYAAGSAPSCTADPTLPCQTIQGDTSGQSFCSPNPCQATTQGWTTTNDTTTGLNDKTNDGPRAADGTCLGQIYLFNGNDMRCRLFDRYGMLNSYAKLVAQIALAATGAGAALATAMSLTGPMAAAIVNAAVQIAVNATIDAATGQLDGVSTLINAATSIIAAGVAGGSTTGWGDQIADTMASYGVNNQTFSYLADPNFATFAQEMGNITQKYSPAIQQGMFGNYSETRCCYPDKLSASCEQNEIKEATLAGNGACHIVGSYCASELLFMCMTAKETSCCFSSKLARIIHEQGRPQLTTFGSDGGWGDPRSPNCRGFTPAEFQSIDMAQIDFSEYIADLNSKIQAVTPKLQEHITDIGQRTGTLLPK